jgi:TonB family protein
VTSVPRVPRGAVLAFALVSAIGGCGRRRPGLAGAKESPSDHAVVSVPRVVARTEPSTSAPAAATLERGAELRIVGPASGFYRARLPRGGEAFVPSGSFERLSDKEARDKRAAAVAKFPPQPGRAIEACPVLLAPDYGAARWGDLRDGDDVTVLLADHDFYGIRIDGTLAFAPARSIRLLPPQENENAPRPTRRPAPPSAVGPRPTPGPEPTAVAAAAPERGRGEPYELLPAGAEAPVLAARVEPRYPEMARRVAAEGEITLKIVVEADGSVGRVLVEKGGHAALVDAATAAVKAWRYRPARVGERPVAVYKTVRIRFTLR